MYGAVMAPSYSPRPCHHGGMAPEKVPGRLVGQITRGTTNTNRLRRVDRWIARHPALRRTADPLVIDLGYGASGVTAFELEARLRLARADVHVHGLEIDPARVARAEEQLRRVRVGAGVFAPDAHVSFARGGLRSADSRRRLPAVIRAFNVLRQYDESEVAPAWSRMAGSLQPDGILRRGHLRRARPHLHWVEVGADAQPRTLTLSLRLAGLDSPAVAAERLPKSLIHRNVPGERVHDFLAALDIEWTRAVAASTFGADQRWRAALEAMASSGWPLAGRSRWRLGEVTVPWDTVAPNR